VHHAPHLETILHVRRLESVQHLAYCARGIDRTVRVGSLGCTAFSVLIVERHDLVRQGETPTSRFSSATQWQQMKRAHLSKSASPSRAMHTIYDLYVCNRRPTSHVSLIYFVYWADIYLMIPTVLGSLLLPFLVALFYFSNSHQRRSAMFACVTLSVVFAVMQAVNQAVLEVRSCHFSANVINYNQYHSLDQGII
jgi:hypothetical protein